MTNREEPADPDRSNYARFLTVLAGVVGAAIAGVAAIVATERRKGGKP